MKYLLDTNICVVFLKGNQAVQAFKFDTEVSDTLKQLRMSLDAEP
jgi:predicted nucleic acid-binding protein